MATAQDAIKQARAYLNDNNGISWTDSILMPLLQAAFTELIQDLDLNSIGVVKYQSPVITVPAGSLDLSTDQPSNILEPISLQERSPGSSNIFFVDMIKVNFLPETVQTNFLTYWAWLGQIIQFIGSTTTREVVLRYKGYLQSPQILSDPIGVIFGENFLGPRIAALCYDIAGKNSDNLNKIAQTNKFKLIQRGVLGDQTPVRRRGYRERKSTWPSRASVPVGQASGGGPMTLIPTSTPADGVRSTFLFPLLPKQILYNGVWQFQNIGYTLAVVSGSYSVTFIDENNNVLIPGPYDDIREQVS